ncbi:hypothetical protein BH11ARM2_BH11ARM2_33560 [soil metagenome]
MLTLAVAFALATQTPTLPPETKAQRDHRMAWWREARFGMFIHWGLYAIPAGEWNGKTVDGAAEWLMNTARVPAKDYEPLAKAWNPTKFDARRWVKVAKDAGMKYIVITSKHHEGFGLWPSKAGDWNVNRTPFKRDVLKELASACKKEGIRLCFYHSIMDWHHPDYLPKRDWDKAGESKADFDRYVAYMKAQLKELLTDYGDIGILWFDGEWEGTWTHDRGKDLYAFVRSLQPNIIVNNRVDTGRGAQGGSDGANVGDYGTPEQTIPANGLPGTDWESCMTMNDTWGFKKTDDNWKSAQTLVRNLIDCASKGGNYLLNVGPTAEGLIPQPSVERLAAVGKWMRTNGASIYGTTAGPFPRALPWGKVTRKDNRLFLQVFTNDPTISLTGLHTDVTSVTTLAGGKKVPYRRTDYGYEVDLKNLPHDPFSTVLALDFRGPIQVETPLQKQSPEGMIDLLAIDATVDGQTAQYEAEKAAIGFWTDPHDTVIWTFEANSGMDNVEIEYACADDSPGATYEVEIGGQKLTGTVEATGGWSQFKRFNVGRITLDSGGTLKLTVRALSKPGLGVMNLRAVRLRRS